MVSVSDRLLFKFLSRVVVSDFSRKHLRHVCRGAGASSTESSQVYRTDLPVDSGTRVDLELGELQSRLDSIDNYWTKFEDLHEKFFFARDSAILDHLYARDQVYNRCLTHYTTARAALVQAMSTKGDGPEPHESLRRPVVQLSTGGTIRPLLPEISLPRFSGDYTQWTSFRDLFSSMVYYLMGCLSGEALQLVKSLTISEESVAIARQALVNRYENPRLLISPQLDQLFGSPPMKNDTAFELNYLMNSVAEALNSLAALGVPTTEWNCVVLYVVSHRLTPKLREAWECRIGSAVSYPTYSDLREFLTGRARAMESIEDSMAAQGKSASSRPGVGGSGSSRATVASASLGETGPVLRKSSPRQSFSSDSGCAFCHGSHFIASCQTFRDLPMADRKRHVISASLCFNCLGRHRVAVCQTSRRCQTCGEKHYTLIHNDNRAMSPRQSRAHSPIQPLSHTTSEAGPASTRS